MPTQKSKVSSQQEKYGYLDSEFRPLSETTGRIPPDPTKQKIEEAEEIGKFVQEFKHLMLTGKFMTHQL